MLDKQLTKIFIKVKGRKTIDESYLELDNALEKAKKYKTITFGISDFLLFSANGLTHSTKENRLRYKNIVEPLLHLMKEKESYDIKTWLKIKDMTQTELCRQTGLTQKAIWDINRGSAKPNYENLVKICSALGIELNELKI